MGVSIDPRTIVLGAIVVRAGFQKLRSWLNRKKELREITDAAVRVQDQSEDYFEEPFEVEVLVDTATRSVKHGGYFRTYLVQCGKARFGTPKENEANRLAVRKYLLDLCNERGLLPRHIVQHLDIATALVFVVSRDELVAKAIRHTDLSRRRNELDHKLSGSYHRLQ